MNKTRLVALSGFLLHGIRHIAWMLLALPLLATLPAQAQNYVPDTAISSSPQFHQKAWPWRVTSGPSGKVYVTFVNGGQLTGVNNQRRGAVIRFNEDGTVDPSFNVGTQFATAWPVIEQANGKVLVGALDSNEADDSGPPLYRVFRLNADGTRDASYQTPVFGAIPRFMTQQPDGKLLVTNQDGGEGNGGLLGLQRLNIDGTLDTSFAPPAVDGVFFSNIVVDTSGTILVGGTFSTVNGVSRPGIARLLSNGALDSTFVPGGFASISRQIRGIAVQTQGTNAGKIVIAGGPFQTTTGSQAICTSTASNYCSLIRLNPDGSLDTSFTLINKASTGVIASRPRVLSLLPNDQLMIVSSGVARFNADGSIDTAYNKPVFSFETYWMDTLADGRVYVPLMDAGLTVNGNAATQKIMRFNADGTADAGFAPGIFQTENYPNNLAVLPDGGFLTWGDFDAVGTTARTGAARFKPDGSLDNSYALSGITDLLGISNAGLPDDGRLLAMIKTGTNPLTAYSTSIARFGTAGAVDTTYIPDSTAAAQATGLRVLPDGRALVWAPPNEATVVNGSPVFFKRLGVTGALDNTFVGLTGSSGQFSAVYADAASPAMTVGDFTILGRYADGRLLAAATQAPYPKNATSFNYTLLRLNADGTLDSTFVAPLVIWNKIYQSVTATFYTTSNGFKQQFELSAPQGSPFTSVLPQADGSVIVYGIFTAMGGQAAPGIARLSSSGALDTTFSVGTGAELRSLAGRTAQVKHVALDASGKYWVSGVFDTFGGQSAAGLTRLNSDGTLDSTFSTSLAYRNYGSSSTHVTFDAANRVLLLGSYLPGTDNFPDAIHRLVTGSTGGTGGGSKTGFLYALNDSTSGNTIHGFSVDESTGSLTPLAGFPVATGGMGNANTRSEELFFDRANARLFAINTGSSTVSAFGVNVTTGALTTLPYSPIAMPGPSLPGTWACLAVHPSGSPLVVGDKINFRAASFNVTSSSATLINTASTANENKLSDAFSCAFSQDGNYFYTGGNATNFDKFSGFGVNASTGALSLLAGSPFFSGAYQMEAFVTDAQGRLFATSNGAPSYTLAYTTSSGIPTRINLPNYLSGLTTGVHGVLHPAGFYMVADRSANRIGVYAIVGSGTATTVAPVAGSAFASGGSYTNALALSQSGNWLFAANGNSRNISVFSVNTSSGALTSSLVQPGNTLGTTGQIDGMVYAPTGVGSTPDPFSFTPQTGVAAGATMASNTVTITGIGAAIPISIVGGEYSIDGGAFSSVAGMVSNGQTVATRLTSSSSYSTLTSAILNVGVVTSSFSVKTQAAPVTISATSMIFGKQVVSTISAAQTVTLSNNGLVQVGIGYIQTTGDFYSTNTCGLTLASGASCTVSVTFTPTVKGARTGAIAVGSPPIGTQFSISVPLSGVGTTPLSLTVTNLNDSGVGSLRDAVVQVNSNPGADTINFDASLQGRLTLTTGKITITDALSINGPGATLLTIDGNASGRIFLIDHPALQSDIGPDFLVSLSGLTLTNGSDITEASKSGGAVKSYKSLTLSNMVLTGNQAMRGGAIAFFPENDAALTISDSTLSSNTALYAAAAGYGCGGALNVSWRYVPTKSTVTLSDSRIENNLADDCGGGMLVETWGLTKVLRSAIVGNQTKALTTFSNKRNGGGIKVGRGDFLMEESEVSGNAAVGVGGGVYVWQEDPNLQTPSTAMHATVSNSTISGNSAGNTAGGVNIHGNVIFTLNASTVVNNVVPAGSTGGVRIGTGATYPASVPASNVVDAQLNVLSSIAWNNMAGTTPLDVARASTFTTVSTPITANNSLAGVISSKITVNGTGNMLGIDPKLGVLANNGGTTQTHLPLTGSPALGSGACIAGVTTDQRGALRPQSGCDMGSVELASAARVPGTPVSVLATPGNARASINFTPPGDDGGAPITSYTVTPSSGGRSSTWTTIPIMVTGLSNGTAYTFTVSANNEAGRSVVSAVSNSVTPMASTVSVSPSSLNFGNQTPTVTSTAQTVTLSNTGTAIVTVSSIAASGDFASSNNCGTYLHVGTNCTISVNFTPKTMGSHTGNLSIITDAVGSPGVVALDGVGSGTSIVLALAQGWNLLGNSLNQTVPVASAFGDPTTVTTVWKWDTITPGWQFYTPQMDAPTLQTYAASKGYGVLSVINPGEGYWVNAKVAASLPSQTGTAFALTSANLVTGWNLVATGNDVTPSAFNTSLSATPPSPGVIPINLTTLWAWDNVLSQWYFYAPSLDASGGLAGYITGKGYLDFTQHSKTLGNGVGFWVNRP